MTLQEVQLKSDEMWNAIRKRNRDYDGLFVFGVRSTGIYCVPSCPSKRPGIEQVVFFSSPEEAEQNSFRACLRCGLLGNETHKKIVEDACRFIDENIDSRLNLAILSKTVGMSAFHFQRVFKKITGISPKEYTEQAKLGRAKLLMRSGESVRRSIYGSGHNSTSWLYSSSHKGLGMRPAEYRKGAENLSVYYSVVDCSLGRLLVAGTRNGICSVSLGDSDEKLESYLRSEYPKAEIERDERTISDWTKKILEYLESNEPIELRDLPLDIRATSFQIKVWKALQAIPYGSTESYGEIAQRISLPKAVRAVANACGANPVPLVVPCHRVIRSDGSLGGYRLGVKRKTLLLQNEKRRVTSKL